MALLSTPMRFGTFYDDCRQLAEPVAWVELQQREFGALRQCRGLVHHKAADLHSCGIRCAGSVAPGRPPTTAFSPPAPGTMTRRGG
jgi:hypothetical protein